MRWDVRWLPREFHGNCQQLWHMETIMTSTWCRYTTKLTSLLKCAALCGQICHSTRTDCLQAKCLRILCAGLFVSFALLIVSWAILSQSRPRALMNYDSEGSRVGCYGKFCGALHDVILNMHYEEVDPRSAFNMFTSGRLQSQVFYNLCRYLRAKEQ